MGLLRHPATAVTTCSVVFSLDLEVGVKNRRIRALAGVGLDRLPHRRPDTYRYLIRSHA